MGECVGICFHFITFIWCKQAQNVHRDTKHVTLNAFKILLYNPSPFAPPSEPSAAPYETLPMHGMLSHALHEHRNPWLISSANQ